MMDELEHRLSMLKQRLQTAYDGIGHSHGRPYIYFVYPPEQELRLRRQLLLEFRDVAGLHFYYLDVLSIVLKSTAGQESRREELLNDEMKSSETKHSMARIWSRRVYQEMNESLAASPPADRPVIVLYGLAALHPLASPTSMMEALAEQEIRSPLNSNQMVPIVLFVPGTRPPQTSRVYAFLGQERLISQFYRGEEA